MDENLNLLLKMMARTIPEADQEKVLRNNMGFIIHRKEFPKIIRQSKNQAHAEEELNEADKLMASASLDELIKRYSKAVAYAEPGSSSLARALANRSVVLTNNSMYEDSLKDIDRALEIGYPDKLKAKLYARRAKSLFGLKGMCPEVKEAIAQTKEWSEKMDEDNRRNVLKTINKLKADRSSKKVIEKRDSSVFLRGIPNDNPKILGASGSIDIRESEEFGRHIVATKDIKAGEVIMAHKFYLHILEPEYVYQHCSYCLRITYSGIPCKKCANFIYCDENCRDRAWNEYHDIECDMATELITHFLLDDPFRSQIICGLRLLIKALKEFGTIDKLYEKTKEIDSTAGSVKKLFTGDVHDASKYASVYSLYRAKSNPPITQTFSLEIARILFILSTTTEILEKKYDDLNEVINDKWVFFVGKLLIRHIEIMVTNEFQLRFYDRERKVLEKCGWFLAPLKDLCNHSCDCNTYSLILFDFDALFAIQPIKKGDQILITYGPSYEILSTQERRSHLQENHKFTCNCNPCVNDWGPDTKFPSCLKKLEAKYNPKKIFKAFDKFNKHTKKYTSFEKKIMYVSPDYFSECIKDLSELLNIIGADNHPSEELIKVRTALIFIIRSYQVDEFSKQIRGSLK